MTDRRSTSGNGNGHATFDWCAYLERYPDLAAAGIDDEEKAHAHWRTYGEPEGRWGTTPSYPTRRTLACPSIHSIYVRWTGDLVCWDDAGNETLLQRYDPRVDYGRDVYLGAPFNRVRFSLSNGEMPFPEVCTRCLVLRTNTSHSSFHLDRRVVEVFQVEPSFKCTLDCPGCVRLDQRKLAPPSNLPPERFEKIVKDLKNALIEVRAFDFQGHGEPILHPQLPAMIETARALYPGSYLTMTTNANAKLKESLLRSGIDEIVCSIDGVDAASYEPYRIFGDFDLALRFMTDAARSDTVRVIWKYILFEHNSDESHLLEAQRIADSIGVDELVFVFTRNGPRSTRVTTRADIPRLPGRRVPLSYRYHQPDLADLTTRRREAEALAAAGDPRRAEDLLRSVRRQEERFGLGTESP
jgi:organic radical activating enzyme